jgi:hypothetical protein
VLTYAGAVQVSSLVGFLESGTSGFGADAAAAMYPHMLQQHGRAEVLPIRLVTSASGKERKVDGAVVAGDGAAIVAVKEVLDDEAVQQLAPCFQFIKRVARVL